jgi:hypothetical protein
MPQNYTSISELVKKHQEMKFAAASISKESPPPPRAAEHTLPQESSEQQPQKSQPVTHYVSKRQDTIQLPPELKSIGVEATASEDTPGLNAIRFPISDEQIMDDLRASPAESKRWYATFFLYVLERAHVTLKRIGTKVVRVIRLG